MLARVRVHVDMLNVTGQWKFPDADWPVFLFAIAEVFATLDTKSKGPANPSEFHANDFKISAYRAFSMGHNSFCGDAMDGGRGAWSDVASDGSDLRAGWSITLLADLWAGWVLLRDGVSGRVRTDLQDQAGWQSL